MKQIDPAKYFSGIFMFDRDYNVKLGGKPLKLYYPKLTVTHVVEHYVLLFFNDVSKISIV